MLHLRSRLNITKHSLDRTNDENALQSQKLRFLSRYLEGNATEIRGRIVGIQLRLDDQDLRTEKQRRSIDEIEQNVRQQGSADLIRHNDLDSRLMRDEKRIQFLENSTAQNNDQMVTLAHSVLEESNNRQSTLEGFEDEMESLRFAIAEVEARASSSRQSIQQNNQQLTEMSEIQTRQSGAVHFISIACI